jgi:chlorobactene glucosyltransferase
VNLIYHWVIFIALALCLLLELINLWYLLRTRRKFPKPPQDILVSVLIPVRNEERYIARCLRGMINQTYRNLEILVLDDGSTDRTAEIVTRFAQEDPRIRLLKGAELPPDWTGKSHACYQLGQAAQGDWLFLTDADDIHKPGSLETGLAYALAQKLDCVTGYPQQLTGGFWEANIVPLLFFFILLQPLLMVRRNRHPDFAVANGQYLLIRHEMYRKAGGHNAVRNIVNEDFALVKNIKRAGGIMDIMDLRGLVYCRMYRGFREATAGFSKNIYLIMGRQPLALLLAMFGMTLFFILPFGFAIRSLALGYTASLNFMLMIGQILLIVIIRMFLAGFQRMSYISVWSHPIGMLLILYIFIHSFFKAEFGKGPSWKGRSYDVKKRGEGFA